MLSEFNHIPFFMVMEDNWSIAEEMLYINNEFGDDHDFDIEIVIVDNTNDFNHIDIVIDDNTNDEDEDDFEDQIITTSTNILDMISSVYEHWEKVLSELDVLLMKRSRRDSMRLIPGLSCKTTSV